MCPSLSLRGVIVSGRAVRSSQPDEVRCVTGESISKLRDHFVPGVPLVKTTLLDDTGQEVAVLCVKGSGWDLGNIEPAGLPAAISHGERPEPLPICEEPHNLVPTWSVEAVRTSSTWGLAEVRTSAILAGNLGSNLPEDAAIKPGLRPSFLLSLSPYFAGAGANGFGISTSSVRGHSRTRSGLCPRGYHFFGSISLASTVSLITS